MKTDNLMKTSLKFIKKNAQRKTNYIKAQTRISVLKNHFSNQKKRKFNLVSKKNFEGMLT